MGAAPNQRAARGELTANFLAVDVVGPELASAIMALDPANPFCTWAHSEAMRAIGHEPCFLGTERDGKLVAGCYGFINSGRLSGRLSRCLWIPWPPDVAGDDVFWDGLLRYCSDRQIHRLALNGLGWSRLRIPELPGEVERRLTCNYVLGLEDPEWERKLRRRHRYNIKRALQAGVTLRRAAGADACREQARLIAASQERRRKRGELIVGSLEEDLALSILLVEKGAGELFLAVAGNKTLSSVIVLRAAEGAYLYNSGTSAEGMRCGAAHFLLYSTARVLRSESMRTFHFGETEFDSGLSLFKSGFGATPVSVERADFYFGSDLRRKLTDAARSLRQIGSDFLGRIGMGIRA